MAIVQLSGANITDWITFHNECRQAFGFPDSYAATVDAWVDCLSYLRDHDGMTKFHLAADETLRIHLEQAEVMRQQVPDILEEMTFLIGGINERYADYGEKPALELVLR